jgi:hypothetical protein
MVIGDRRTATIEHFSPLKKRLQRLGGLVVRRVSATKTRDVTSGFRAYNREAALQLQVVTRFTYTLETIIQAGRSLVAVENVPVRTNAPMRESRLFPSTWTYVRRNVLAIIRVYTMYEPLRVFFALASIVGLAALAIWVRFLYYLASGGGHGHIQSVILGGTLLVIAVQLAGLGIMADVLAANRLMLQRNLERVRRLELHVGVRPSRYVSGSAERDEEPTPLTG